MNALSGQPSVLSNAELCGLNGQILNDSPVTRDIDVECNAFPSRNPLSARYHELLKEIGELHDRKQKDYGTDKDPFANVRSTEQWGIPGWVGAAIRLNDKVHRLQTLATKGTLANEPVKDSFMDIAVYALIGLVLYEEEFWKEASNDGNR